MPSQTWQPGSYIAGCALTTGFAVVVINGLDVVCYTSTGGPLTDAWTMTLTEPAGYVSCASDGTNVRAVVQGFQTKKVHYLDGTTDTDLGAVYGIRGCQLQRESSNWVAYICRTAKQYVRWVNPTGGASATVANPFTAKGTAEGMRYISGTTPQWAESTVTPGTLATTTISSAVFVLPMTVSGKTVGQSEGQPFSAPQIIGYDGTSKSTIFAVEGYDPHLVALSGSKFLITARTKEVANGQGAGVLIAPPWPAFDPFAQLAPPSIYQPNEAQWLGDGEGDRKGRLSQPAESFLRQLTQQASTPINVNSIAIAGGSASPVTPSGATNLADYVVGTSQPSLPNARVAIDSATIAVDATTAGEMSWDYIGPTIAGPVGPPGRRGEDGARGRTLLMRSRSSVSYVPVSTGAEPLEIMSNGAGAVLLVPYTP